MYHCEPRYQTSYGFKCAQILRMMQKKYKGFDQADQVLYFFKMN